MEGGLEGEGKKLHGRKGGLPGSGGVADGPDSKVGDEEGAGPGLRRGVGRGVAWRRERRERKGRRVGSSILGKVVRMKEVQAGVWFGW